MEVSEGVLLDGRVIGLVGIGRAGDEGAEDGGPCVEGLEGGEAVVAVMDFGQVFEVEASGFDLDVVSGGIGVDEDDVPIGVVGEDVGHGAPVGDVAGFDEVVMEEWEGHGDEEDGEREGDAPAHACEAAGDEGEEGGCECEGVARGTEDGMPEVGGGVEGEGGHDEPEEETGGDFGIEEAEHGEAVAAVFECARAPEHECDEHGEVDEVTAGPWEGHSEEELGTETPGEEFGGVVEVAWEPWGESEEGEEVCEEAGGDGDGEGASGEPGEEGEGAEHDEAEGVGVGHGGEGEGVCGEDRGAARGSAHEFEREEGEPGE